LVPPSFKTPVDITNELKSFPFFFLLISLRISCQNSLQLISNFGARRFLFSFASFPSQKSYHDDKNVFKFLVIVLSLPLPFFLRSPLSTLFEMGLIPFVFDEEKKNREFSLTFYLPLSLFQSPPPPPSR